MRLYKFGDNSGYEKRIKKILVLRHQIGNETTHEDLEVEFCNEGKTTCIGEFLKQKLREAKEMFLVHELPDYE